MPSLSKFLIDYNLMSLTEQTKPFNYIKDVMSQIIEERKSKNIVICLKPNCFVNLKMIRFFKR